MVTAVDASGNGNDGTYFGTPTYGVTGLLVGDADTAVSLPADDLNDNGAQGASWTDPVTDFTIEAIVKFADLRESYGYQFIAGLSGPGFTDLEIYLANVGAGDNQIQAFLNGVGGNSFLASGVAAAINTRYHVACTYDGSDFKLYINGTEVDTAAFVGTPEISGTTYFLAGDNNLGGNGVNGVLDEVAFYDTALSPTRVGVHATAVTGGGYSAAALADAPVIYWRLGEGATPGPEPGDYPSLSLTADVGDLTPYGEEPAFSVQRGTTSPGLTGFVAEAGNGATLLDNISRDLDPENASGPFFGQLRPKVGTVLTATWDGTGYTLLTGRVDDWPQSYPKQGVEQYVDFRATDLFQFLANTPINTTRPPETTGARIQAVLDSIGYPGATDIAPGMSTVVGQDLSTVAALTHLGDCAQVEYGEMWIDAAGTFYFRDRLAIATETRSTDVQAAYVQSGGLNFVEVTRASRPLVNHITITYGKDGRQVTVRDQDSIDDNDLQSMTVSLPFETASQARGYGRWLLLLYSTPRSDFTSVTFEPINTPGATPDLWAEVLSRKEGDLVQITLDPLDAPYELSGAPIVEMCWIRGVGYQFGQFPWRVTFTPQPSWAEGLFIMDTSELDGPDVMML